MFLTFFGLATRAHAQCGSPVNAIVAENCLTGNSPDEWDTKASDAGDPSIQGFATDISVNVGGTVFFKINTPASSYSINIYRMGYYKGMGARKIATITPSAHLPQTQPACATDTTTGLIDCGNWAVSASWAVPANATSGVYFAHLVRTDTTSGEDSHIVFIVRNDSSHSAILYQTSDETWQAYNYYGAGSLYGQASPNFDLNNRSYKVSYNRPFLTRNFQEESDTFVFGAEAAMIQWIEQNGYDVTYFTGIDAARNGTLIKNHKIYMDAGHDEYWTGPHRASVEAARDAGVNLAFFSGNEVFWKTRLENSIDGTNTPNRTLVCYKETLAFAKTDPSDPPTWTGTWRDPSFSPPADGGKPENSLTGTIFMVNGVGPDNDGSLSIQVPAADGKMRFWRNTAAANLAANQTYTLPAGTLGYEWDEDLDNGFRPAGAFHLSTSTYDLTSDHLLDAGATYGAGTATHHMMLYRAPSGALVFGAGTIDWSWGLNSNHDNPFLFYLDTPNPDPNMQQATVNLFADMGVQPGTLQPGLVPATASSDATSPISTISFPAAGSTLNTGTAITVTGTATDSGGAVGGVEVSGDNGATWHPATGRGTWSYVWTPSKTGATTLLSRAVDDSANLETPHGVNLTVAPQTCPCSIWNTSIAPQNADSGDVNSIEVGLKFRADADGAVVGVRFYKAPTNTGTHIGHLWSSTGTLLGTATFTGESNSGWQQVNFSSPIPVTANTTYIVSYFAPAGHYSNDTNFFAQAGVDDPPLHALANGVDGPDAVYLYTSSPGGFPNVSYRSTNYWVDVVYTSSNTYSLSGSISGPGGGGALVSLSGAETLSLTADSMGNYSFDGLINGTYTVTPSNSGVTFTPASRSVAINGGIATGINFTAVVTSPQTISGTISGGAGSTVNLSGAATATTTADASGNYSFPGLLNGSYAVVPSKAGVLFTPGAQSVVLSGVGAAQVNFQAQVCNCVSIWQPSITPTVVDSSDATPVELGVKFRADVNGVITGLRFYKAAANTGTHIGHIWSSSGVLLGSANFTGETASGWQQVTFTSPIAVTANTTYVASYFAPVGHYSADTGYFAASAKDSPPLHALQDGTDGPNGVYLYASSGGFPTNTYSSTNYWVDVLFSGSQSYSISGTITGTGGAGATVSLNSGSSTITTTANASGSYTFTGVYPGSYSITPSNTAAAFIPGTQNVTISNAAATGVNFTESQLCPCDTIWQPTALPAVVDSGDAASIELGVKFQADFDGYILGVRFYKSAANTGVHTGNLWSTAGTGGLLATSTFSSESSSGWQQMMFANPVPISANTPYLASYFAPQGHYSTTNLLFDSAGIDSPPLHALMNTSSSPNGVFIYSPTSAYPASAFNASGYWVDVIYSQAASYSIAGTISGGGGTGATVTLTGAASMTTTADASGSYSFSGLANGTYTVTVTKSGVTFSPATQAVTINGSHALGVNFTSSQPSYSISGTISGAPGDSVALSGTSTATTTADGSGNYSFTGLLNGSYTVTPGSVGFTISPSSQPVTVNNANVTAVNFTSTAQTFIVSGTISGGAGAVVSLSGSTNATTTADASGNFSFTGLINGSYVVTPAKSGLIFNPASLTATVFGANVTNANFTVPANCPCDTIWQPTVTPAVVDVGDNHATETGVKFRVDADGYITGIRFYKSAANTGVHLGNLWSSTGTLLGTATFSNETLSGWQQVLFSGPVPVVANTTYIASYFSPVGHYSADSGYFTSSGMDSPPLHALMNGIDGENGVYIYSGSSAFPNASFNAANYWADIIYTPTTTYSIAGNVSGAGGVGATIKLTGAATATFSADASGNFSFNNLANGSYTVTPSNSSGFTYSPASQTVTINNGHVLGLAFASSQLGFSITGVISGAGGSGATVTLSGASSASVVANSSGAYAFSNLANGSYTVTPTKAGATFTPASQAVTINGANGAANFASSAQTFTITGTVSGSGGSGATVTLSGASTGSTTASSTGTYSFTGLVNGSYTVTPSKTGFTFTPPSQAVTVNGANGTANFSSASTATFTISGTISGAGGATATVQLTGASTATVTASSTGAYTFTGLANGSYTVTPAKTGFTFTPASQAVTLSGANKTANFSSTAQSFNITGIISGSGGSGATVILTGAKTATATANSSGAYSFTGLANGAYTVAPTKTGFSFTPASQAVTISGANGTANFATQTFTISGTISGAGGPSATVKLTGASTATVTANSAGSYSFTALVNGSYTVTPSKTGFTFAPANQAVTISGANKIANFSSSITPTFSITGTISGSGASGATVTLTGAATATVTASATGVYTFTGLANGSYTVTPSKTGHIFLPLNLRATVNSRNVTGVNFSSF